MSKNNKKIIRNKQAKQSNINNKIDAPLFENHWGHVCQVVQQTRLRYKMQLCFLSTEKASVKLPRNAFSTVLATPKPSPQWIRANQVKWLKMPH